jgi:hypothetical protein
MSSASIFLSQSQNKRVNQIFDKLRPTPRIWIEFLSNPTLLNDYENQLRDAISHVTINQLEVLCKDTSSLTMGALSHKLCLISRKREAAGNDVIVAPITEAIRKKLARRFQNVQRENKSVYTSTF